MNIGIYEQDISISGNTFSLLRTDVDNVMQMLLSQMIKHDSNEGKVNISIKVSLSRESISNTESDAGHRLAYSPKFEYDTSYSMQVKDKISGESDYDDMELVRDDVTRAYILRTKTGREQMSIYDVDYQKVDDKEKN